MKKHAITLSLLFSLVFLSGCVDLLDVEKSFTFQQIFSVNTDQQTFNDSHLFDLAANVSIIEEYGSMIKEVRIEKVEFWLTAFVGSSEQAFEGGSLSVSNPDGSNTTLIASLGELVLQDLVNNKQTMTLNTSGVNMLGDLAAEPPHSFKLNTEGSVNQGPLIFTIVFEFTAKMVANPLN